MSDSQLGSQAWLIQRAALPPTLASMTWSSSMWKKNVWSGSSGLCGWRRSACFHVIIWPLYSMIVSPFLILRIAYTPRPCTPERRTWMRRPLLFAAWSPIGGLGGLAGLIVRDGLRRVGMGVLDVVFIGYIEIRRARVRVRARA